MKQEIIKAILFANGDFLAPERFLPQLTSQDFLIAVDGGLKLLTQHDLIPDLIIGDLDSAQPEDVEKFRSQGIEVRKYPVEKDQTDLELSLDAALELKPSTIWVVAALGNRLDQTLANILLLTRTKFNGIDLRLLDGRRQVFLIRESASLEGTPGDRVSLLPLSQEVAGVTTRGLYYPLENETLFRDQTRGISNHMTSSTAIISIQHGLLLCVHDSLEPEERID